MDCCRCSSSTAIRRAAPGAAAARASRARLMVHSGAWNALHAARTVRQRGRAATLVASAAVRRRRPSRERTGRTTRRRRSFTSDAGAVYVSAAQRPDLSRSAARASARIDHPGNVEVLIGSILVGFGRPRGRRARIKTAATGTTIAPLALALRRSRPGVAHLGPVSLHLVGAGGAGLRIRRVRAVPRPPPPLPPSGRRCRRPAWRRRRVSPPCPRRPRRHHAARPSPRAAAGGAAR